VAMEGGEIRIYDRRILDVAEHDAPDCFIVSSPMDPHAIENNVVGGRFIGANEVVDEGWRFGSRHLQAQQAIVVCPGIKPDGSIAAARGELDLCQYVLCGSTLQRRAAGERRDAGI